MTERLAVQELTHRLAIEDETVRVATRTQTSRLALTGAPGPTGSTGPVGPSGGSLNAYVMKGALGPDALAYDSFTRADGAIGVADSTQAWAVAEGTVSISSNKASGVDGTAVIDVGTPDVDVTGVFDPAGASGNARLVFRYIDVSNQLFARFGGSPLTQIVVAKIDGGVTSTIVSFTGLTITDPATLRVVARGSNIKVYLGGVLVGQRNLSEAEQTKYSAGTSVGFRLRSTSRMTRFIGRKADPQSADRVTDAQRGHYSLVSRDVHRLGRIAREEHSAGATIQITDFGLTLPGGGVNHFRGAVLAPDGTLFCIPRSAGYFVLVEPDGTVISHMLGLTALQIDGMNVSGGTLGPDGRIYCPPRDGNEVLVIDWRTRTAVLTDFGADLTTSNGVAADKWTGGVLGPDGLIYCLPTSGRDILIIDPFAQTARKTTFGLFWQSGKQFAGGGLGPDGKIYLPPFNNNSAPTVGVMIIDPLAQTARFEDYGLDLTGVARWSSTTTGADGRIYCCPREASKVLRIDPFKETAELIDWGLTLTDGLNKWPRIINGADGKLYAAPAEETRLLVIDPIADTAQLTDFGTTIPAGVSKWIGGAQHVDGKIYFVPDTRSDFLVVTPAASAPWPFELLLSPLWNKSP